MAYTTATLVVKDPPLTDGRTQIVVEFTGAGEVTKRANYMIGPLDTGTSIRRWAIATAKSFADVKTIADNLTVGQSVNLSAIADPAPTAQQVWQAKVNRYLAGKDLGLTGTTAVADLAALKADIEATYLSAYL